MQAMGEVVNGAVSVPEVTEDIDRQPRDAQPDIGADEVVARANGL